MVTKGGNVRITPSTIDHRTYIDLKVGSRVIQTQIDLNAIITDNLLDKIHKRLDSKKQHPTSWKSNKFKNLGT